MEAAGTGWPDRQDFAAAFSTEGGCFCARSNRIENSLGMELDFALLAEAADTSSDGKLHMLGGGFDGVAIPQVGFTAPPLAIIVRFSVDITDFEAEHNFSLQLIRPDGTEKWPVERAPLQFARPLEGRRSQTTAIVRAVMKFEEIGKHEIKVYGDGVHVKTLDMHVVVLGNTERAE